MIHLWFQLLRRTAVNIDAPLWFHNWAVGQEALRVQREIDQDALRVQREIDQEALRVQRHGELVLIITNSPIKWENSRALNPNSHIYPISQLQIDGNVAVPDNFPLVRGNLLALPGAEVDALLQFYGLDINGNVNHRRIRLGRHIGIRL